MVVSDVMVSDTSLWVEKKYAFFPPYSDSVEMSFHEIDLLIDYTIGTIGFIDE